MNERINNVLVSGPVRAWNEYVWPLISNVGFVRPMHFAATRFIAGISQGDRVLELGSGYPLYELYADKVGRQGLFVALDNNPAIQKRARFMSKLIDRYLRKGEKTTNQIVADAIELPFVDNSFDQVLVSHGPYDTEEVSRVLKPGGRLLVSYTEGFFGIPISTIPQYLALKHSSLENVRVFPGVPAFFTPSVLGYTPQFNLPVIGSVPYFGLNWYISARKSQ